MEPASMSAAFLRKSCGMERKSLESFHHYGPDYGFTSSDVQFDFAKLRQNREAYIDRARSSYDGSFKRNGVDMIEGRAHFR